MYTFFEYQIDSRVTATYPAYVPYVDGQLNFEQQKHIFEDSAYDLIYPLLGLSGETGEVIEKVKKIIRNKNGVVSEEDREDIKKELGDVLWYLTQIASDLDIDLESVAKTNIKKICSRKERGLVLGEGDDR